MTADVARLEDRLRRLVTLETPSGDRDRLCAAYEPLAAWGAEALGRPPEEVVEGGVPHLLWSAPGPADVLVVGHADTVFPAGTVERRPFRVEDGRAFGPGVFDMKAGLVVALDALERVAGTDRVALLVTGDEETGSLTSRALIEDVAREAAAVLVLEPSLDGALKIGRKGGAFYHLTFHGLAAHAGLEPELGHNALLAMARWAASLAELADPGSGTTVTPTLAAAGTAQNVVPDRATLTVDVRASALAELERVDDEIRRRVTAAGTDDVHVDVDGGINRPPLEAHSSTRLAALCREQARLLGLPEPGSATVGGGSDGNFTAALGVPTLDGLGPVGGGAHAEHEWVALDSLRDRVPLVAGMVGALVAG